MVEKIPMRKSVALASFPGLDLSTATTFKVGEFDKAEDRSTPT